MGNTFRLSAGDVDAVESVFGDGGRLRFVVRLFEGEGMSEVRCAFSISRKTGCKIFNRYKKEERLNALADRSRRAAMPTRYRTRWRS